MPFEQQASLFESLSGFDSFVDEKIAAGVIREDQLGDPGMYDLLKDEYAKSFDNKADGRIQRYQLDALNAESVNDARVQRDQYQQKVQQRQEDLSFADQVANQMQFFQSLINPAVGFATGVTGAGSRDDTENAFQYSFDQAQRLLGEGVATLGDAMQQSFIAPERWLGEWASSVGQNIVAQQNADIAAGGYQSVYQGGILDQNRILDMGGWILEKVAENSVSGGLALGGSLAGAVTTGGTSLLIQGATIAGTSLQAIGDVATELKEKEVYDSDNASGAVAVGILSGALDMVGASRVIPKAALINSLHRNGVVDQVAGEVKRSGVLSQIGKGIATEAFTEVLQEGINMSYAASQGADYEADEVVGRFVDSAVVGGVMGGGFSATAEGIAAAANRVREAGQEPNIANVSRQVEQDQVDREIVGSGFLGENIAGMTAEQTRAYVATVADSESDFDLDVVNKHGYAGMYQMGAAILSDIGLIDSKKLEAHPDKARIKRGLGKHREFMENPDNWTIEGGLEAFLSSREVQDNAFSAMTNLNIKRGFNSGSLNEQSTAAEIAGYAKAAHLVGSGDADKYVQTGKDEEDGNNTKASTYYQLGFEAVANTRAGRNEVAEDRPAYRGPKKVVRDAQGNRHNVEYDIVEADSLGATIGTAQNQFRDRNRQALNQQVEAIARDLDYGLLDADSATLEQGAPALAQDNQVIAGNGRVAAIKRAYETGAAENYRQGVIGDAEYVGLDPAEVEKLDKPVLIRRFSGDVNVESLAILSNEGGAASMSPLEQARVDADRIQSLHDFNPDDDGNIDFRSAEGMFKRLLGQTPQNQVNALQSADGGISQEGQRRIRNALLFMAYGDSEVLSRLVESTDAQQANILKALTGAAPAIAEMRDGINQGLIYDADITPDLIKSVEIFSRIKSDRDTVDNYINQLDAFGNVSPETVTLLQKLNELTRSPNKLRDFFIAYAENLKTYGNPSQQGLFGAVEPTRTEVLQRAEQGSEFRRSEPEPESASDEPAQAEQQRGSGQDERPAVETGEQPRAPQPDTDGTRQPEQGSSGARPILNPGSAQPADITRTPQEGDPLTLDGGNSGNQPPTPPTDGSVDPDYEPDFEKNAVYEPTSEDTLLSKISDFITKWFRSATRANGVEAQNALEALQSTRNASRYATARRLQQMKRASNPDGRVKLFDKTDEKTLELMTDYLLADPAVRQSVPLPNEYKLIADGMRDDIDERSRAIIEEMRVDVSRRAGYEVTTYQLLNNQWIDVVDPDTGEVTATAQSLAEEFAPTVRSANVINNNIDRYVTRTYEIHTHPTRWKEKVLTSNDEKFVKIRADAQRYFYQLNLEAGLNPAQAEQKAIQDVTDFIVKRSDSRQEGILFERSTILNENPELRALLGEHTDPRQIYAQSISRMDEIIALKTFYNQLSSLNMNVYDNQDAELNLREIRVGKGTVFNNPFHGKFADKETALFIENALDDQRLDSWLKWMVQANGLWQVVTIPLSVTTSAANIASTIPVVLSTASLHPSTIKEGWKSLTHVFMNQNIDKFDTDKFNDEFGFTPKEVLDFAVKNDIFSGGAMEGEIRRYANESGFDSIQSWLSDAAGVVGYKAGEVQAKALTANDVVIESGGRAGGQIAKDIVDRGGNLGAATVDFALNVYSFGDSLPKAAIFLERLRQHKKLSDKYGEGVVSDTLGTSAHSSKQQAPQYSRTPRIVKAIRQAPTHGLFVSFKAQLYQTTYNQARINLAYVRPEANKEFLKRHEGIDIDGARTDGERQQLVNELRLYGTQKMAAQTATLFTYGAVLGAALTTAFGALGDEPGEEEMAAINQLMPEYYRFIDKAYIGRDDNGNPQFINTARMDMYGDINTALRIPTAYLSGEIPDAGTAAKLLADNIVGPFIDPTFVTRMLSSNVTNADEYGRAIIRNEDGLIGSAGNVFSYLSNELFTNGTTKTVGEIFNDLFSDDEYHKRTGEPYSAGNALMGAMGMQVIGFDAKKQLASALMTNKRAETTLRKQLNGHLKSFHTISDDDLSGRLITARAEHNRIYDNVLLQIEAGRALGMTNDELFQAAKLARISRKDFDNYLLAGKRPPFLMKKLGTGSQDFTDFRNLPDASKAIFSRNYERARALAQSLPAF